MTLSQNQKSYTILLFSLQISQRQENTSKFQAENSDITIEHRKSFEKIDKIIKQKI